MQPYPEWSQCGGYPTGVICGALLRTEGIGVGQFSRLDSFVVYKLITCSSSGGDGGFRSLAVLERDAPSGVEEALAAGVDQSSNPFFGDADVAVLNSGTAVSPGVGLSFLEEAIGATCRKGMIHATPAVISALQAFPFGDMEMALETANGTPVVSGMGYQDVDTPWLAEPGATEDWIFATGPVEVHLGPLVMTDISETLDRSDNTVTFRAEHYVVSIWDTALQAAVLVDWAT
jgi:hypothetical protein